ncbi:hypothetical protein EDB87DRAFT_1683189 [Lactarius vividus]|nr:hypothetical protein EDB87DRAFT_1683189 [Lactarius vividus]
MFNSTSPSASHDPSNRTSRTSNGTPSSRSAPELETALHEGLITDGRNQGRAQSLVRDTYGNPIPFPPMYANFWNGANWFPGHSAGNAAGNPSGGDGYPSASAVYYGQPMPPNFQSGQTGDNRGMFYSGFPATTSPLPGGSTTHPPRPTPSVYPTSNQGEPAAIWYSYCWINRAERDEVHMTVVLRRSPPA